MYCQFYGLKERPFNVTSDPAFFFSSKKHKEAISHLIYGVSQRKGIIVLTGEIGTGKTTICRFLLNHLGKNVKTAFILNPAFSESQLLESIIKDFGIAPKTKLDMVWELNNFLLRESNAGNNLVLIVDEAQNLKPNLLEQIRLLSNLETEKDKLLQVILVGQPELNNRINLYDLRQLRQRIMVRYHIGPLDNDEIKAYINHRLEVAGAQDRPQGHSLASDCQSKKIEFSNEAIDAISCFSGGTPRLINMICDRALLAGFVTETNHIDFNIIKRCIGELGSYSVKAG
ncbi:MAG: AAA family ATPase [Candidatus Omnitrophica bacterium]|nr:AAA family ATPase [Candidatus Omnitrophota bacterium]MBU1923440.1 AAA family ATPase [Candidatus Omnitrophota bacterium]